MRHLCGVASQPIFFDSVEKCLKICGLEEYAEAAIGSLNIEFRKRTTIAVELAAKVG